MTVENTNNRWVYNGDGSTPDFAYDNLITAKSDLAVYVAGTLASLGTDYDVTGVGVTEGGNVHFQSGHVPPIGEATVVIVSAIPLKQTFSLKSITALPPAAFNLVLDKIVRLIQQVSLRVDRTLRQADADPANIGTLPIATDRADKVAAYDVDGNPTVSTLTLTELEAQPAGAAASAAAAALSASAAATSASASSSSATSSATSATASQTAQAAAEAVAAGMKWRPSVRVATTANITLSGTQTIDGVAVVAGDRVLVQNQSAPAQNGVYVCASGAWSRAADADSWGELVSQCVAVEEGTVNADYTFICTVNAGGTIGSTSVTWSTFKITLPDGGVAFIKLASAALAAQADAEAGTSNVLLMTPLRTAQAIAALQVSAVKFARLTYQEANTVAGEAYAASGWRIVGLNTEVQDPSSIVSLATKKVTLIAGTYVLRASVVLSFANTAFPQMRIWNSTTSANVAFANASGGGNATGTQVGGRAAIECYYISNGTDALEIDIHPGGQPTVAPQPTSTGNAEVYAEFTAMKIA